MKKPDRFERVVLKAMKPHDKDFDVCCWLNGPEVVDLLRKEHRWMERMVETIEPDYESAQGLRKVILRALKQRQK